MIRLEILSFHVVIVFSGLFAQATENPYCVDLASVSCKQDNVVADGTGTRYFQTPEEISDALKPAFEKAKPKIESEILHGIVKSSPLGKGKNSLQAKAIQAYGLNLEKRSGCHVLAPPTAEIRTEVEALSGEQRTEMIRECHLRLRDLLFEHLKVQSLAGARAKHKFPSTASAEAMLRLEESVEFKSVLSFMGGEVEREALKGDLDQRIRELFPDVKALMIARIRSMGLSVEDEKRAVERIEKTTYRPGTCTLQLQGNRLYDANAYLSPGPEGKSTFSFCPAFLLSTDSEFALVAIMAHEMAHAIDPCRMGSQIAYNKKEYDPALETIFDREAAVGPLLGCLRNSASVGAVSCSLAELKARKAKCEEDPVECLIREKNFSETNDEGTLQITPCHSDQIIEAVSDWFGAETLEAYMRERRPKLTREQFRAGVSNAFRPICEEEPHDTSAPACLSHPPAPKRIERIINAHPQLRTRMGCAEKHAKGHLYCDRGPMPQDVLGGKESSGAPAGTEQTGSAR